MLAVSAVDGAEKKRCSELQSAPAPARLHTGRTFPLISPIQHDNLVAAWNTSPAGFAAKRDAVNDVTISITVSGSVGAVTCRRYAYITLPVPLILLSRHWQSDP